jgi:hypothetical protein
MIGTYCLKISISEFFSGEIWGLWWLFRVHKKNKNPLYELQWIFLWPSEENIPPKTKIKIKWWFEYLTL